MIAPIPIREHATVALALIDAPTIDARLGRDPEKLEELARDIQRRGLIEPLKVVRSGERLELVDGFRRYQAMRSLALEQCEVFIYPTKTLALEGIKYAANAFREDMSPADEAVYFWQLYTGECGQDIERVAATCGKTITYVDGRLQLLNGDELVFTALKDRQIKITVAHELNKIADAAYRRYYLEHAIKSGATGSVVAGWVIEWKNLFGGPAKPAAPEPDASYLGIAPSYDPHRCHVCGKSDPRRMTVELRVHAACLEAILDPLLDSARGGGAPDDVASDPRRI